MIDFKKLLPETDKKSYCFFVNNIQEIKFITKLFNFEKDVVDELHNNKTITEILVWSEDLKYAGFGRYRYLNLKMTDTEYKHITNTKDIIFKYKILTLKNKLWKNY